MSLLPWTIAVVPMTFEFSMGVRKGEQALKEQLEQALDRRQAEIAKILDDYGVPLLPLKPPGRHAEGKGTEQGSRAGPAATATTKSSDPESGGAAPVSHLEDRIHAGATGQSGSNVPGRRARSGARGGLVASVSARTRTPAKKLNKFTGKADAIKEGRAIYMKYGLLRLPRGRGWRWHGCTPHR